MLACISHYPQFICQIYHHPSPPHGGTLGGWSCYWSWSLRIIRHNSLSRGTSWGTLWMKLHRGQTLCILSKTSLAHQSQVPSSALPYCSDGLLVLGKERVWSKTLSLSQQQAQNWSGSSEEILPVLVRRSLPLNHWIFLEGALLSWLQINEILWSQQFIVHTKP